MDQKVQTQSCEEASVLGNCYCDLQVCCFSGLASLFSDVPISLLLKDLVVLPNFKRA
jgi:hypothetical protein